MIFVEKMADDEESFSFSTPVKRRRISFSMQNISPILSSVSNAEDETICPSFDTTESTEIGFFLSDSSDQELVCQASESEGYADLKMSLIGQLLISSCCTNNCLLTLCTLDILNTRKHFEILSVSGRRTWLMDRLRNDSQITGSEITTKFIVAGKQVCKSAWCKVLPVSEKTVSSIIQQIGKGQVQHTVMG